MCRCEKQANLIELLRSKPPRVILISFPMWGIPYYKAKNAMMKNMNMITSLEKKKSNKQVRFAYECVYKVYFYFTLLT